MWPKRQEPWRRGATGCSMLSQQLLVPIPQRPQQELEELRLEEGEPPREAAVEPEPERQEEFTCRSECKERQTAEEREHKVRHTGFKPQGGTCSCTLTAPRKVVTYPPPAETVQGYCTGWEPATWYQVLTTHGTCTLDLRSRSKETSIASANYAPAKEQKVAQTDSDVTQTSSSSEEGQ